MVPVLLVALLIAGGGVARPPDLPVCVVAHVPAGVDPGSVDLEWVRRIFLVRQRFWPDGSAAHPVNLPPDAPEREAFSTVVLGRSIRDLAAYWNDRYFHGTRPPPTVASVEALRILLERTPGSVGYVWEADTDALPAGVVPLLCVGAGGEGGVRRPRDRADPRPAPPP